MGEQTAEIQVEPFGNAWAFMHWFERNCDQCAKYDTCPMRDALEIGTVTGEIPISLAHRIGWNPDPTMEHPRNGSMKYKCREFERDETETHDANA